MSARQDKSAATFLRSVDHYWIESISIVIAARQIQEVRFKDFKGIHCNAQMTERLLHQFAEPDAASMDMLRMAMERLKLSARAYSRILKVARTIADLDHAENVQSQHIAEAIGYRNLDRGDWAERGL